MMSLRPVLLALALCVATAVSARSAADFFSSAPDSVFRLLPQSTRLDMLDYFHFGSSKSSPNHLGGQAAVTAESPAVVSYRLSERGRGQLAVLSAGTDTLVAVVTTVLTPLPDSRLAWYHTDWSPARPPVEIPSGSAWLTPEGKQRADRVAEIVPFMLVEASFDPEGTQLSLSNAARDFVAQALRDEAAGLVIPEMSFAVSGLKFIRR